MKRYQISFWLDKTLLDRLPCFSRPLVISEAWQTFPKKTWATKDNDSMSRINKHNFTLCSLHHPNSPDVRDTPTKRDVEQRHANARYCCVRKRLTTSESYPAYIVFETKIIPYSTKTSTFLNFVRHFLVNSTPPSF